MNDSNDDTHDIEYWQRMAVRLALLLEVVLPADAVVRRMLG